MLAIDRFTSFSTKYFAIPLSVVFWMPMDCIRNFNTNILGSGTGFSFAKISDREFAKSQKL